MEGEKSGTINVEFSVSIREVRLFDDDTVMSLSITANGDITNLQEHRDNFVKWKTN